MPNRTAAFVSAVFVACLTGIALTPTSSRAAPAEAASTADECLSAPKAATPAGGHWYYRIEKGTKRKCWYLGDAGGKTNKVASAKPNPESESASDEQSLADARAEIPRGRMSPEENSEQTKLSETTWPPLEPATDAAVLNDPPANNIQTLNAQDLAEGSNIASRWPAVTSVASAEAQPQTETRAPTPALTADRLAAVAAKPQQAANPQPISQPQDTAQAQVEESVMTTPVRMLLLLLTGALVLAAILGRMIVKRLSARRNVPGHRRPIWDTASSDDETLPYIQDLSAPRRTYAARELPMASEPQQSDQAERIEELEELLQRASKRSAA